MLTSLLLEDQEFLLVLLLIISWCSYYPYFNFCIIDSKPKTETEYYTLLNVYIATDGKQYYNSLKWNDTNPQNYRLVEVWLLRHLKTATSSWAHNKGMNTAECWVEIMAVNFVRLGKTKDSKCWRVHRASTTSALKCTVTGLCEELTSTLVV